MSEDSLLFFLIRLKKERGRKKKTRFLSRRRKKGPGDALICIAADGRNATGLPAGIVAKFRGRNFERILKRRDKLHAR